MAGFHADSFQKPRLLMKFLKETKAAGIKTGAHHTDAQSYDAIYSCKVMKEQNVSGTKSSLSADRLAIKEGLRL